MIAQIVNNRIETSKIFLVEVCLKFVWWSTCTTIPCLYCTADLALGKPNNNCSESRYREGKKNINKKTFYSCRYHSHLLQLSRESISPTETL